MSDRGRELMDEAQSILDWDGADALDDWDRELSPEDRAALDEHWASFVAALRKMGKTPTAMAVAAEKLGEAMG